MQLSPQALPFLQTLQHAAAKAVPQTGPAAPVRLSDESAIAAKIAFMVLSLEPIMTYSWKIAK
ncbi:MAG: hypothetical protein CL949_14375 [Erythrobacter sp.]|nr:hypothetical protein [Erythrobacter sp.]|tara:strand:- start:711 stop:899 length:189 start_codon:yes stop_codon:yes gene_type:complete